MEGVTGPHQFVLEWSGMTPELLTQLSSSQPGVLNVNSQGWTTLLVNFSRRVSSQPDHPANFEDPYL